MYPPPLKGKEREKYRQAATKEPVPVEVHQPVYNPDDDDAIMEDAPKKKR